MDLLWYVLLSPLWVWAGASLWMKRERGKETLPSDEKLALLRALQRRVLRCSPEVRLEDRQRVLLEQCEKEKLVSIVKETHDDEEYTFYVLTEEGRQWVYVRR